MKLIDMPKEEIEVLSYTDLTYMILKENKKTMNTAEIFKEISSLLGYSEDEYVNKIGDFYTQLALDKRFVLLDNAEWDLREKRSVEISYDDDDEDESEHEDVEEEEIEEDHEIIDEIDDTDDLDDDTLDLNITTEEEIEEEM